MDDLLPHYERELALLRGRAADFARQHPKIAGRLQLSGDVGDDPHVERLIEAFALLAARIHKRLDDDFPLFTESLVDLLYPHFLRPFPSCALARFELGAQAAQMGQAVLVPRGTLLQSRSVQGVTCRFRTTADLRLMPVSVTDVRFSMSARAPEGTHLPQGAVGMMSLVLHKQSPQAQWRELLKHPLRLSLDGEASQVAALREALCSHALGVRLEARAHRPWQGPLDGREAKPQLAGFEDAEALIDMDARAHPAYRLLTEYFAFPDKFNAVTLACPPAMLEGALSRGDEDVSHLTLHLPLAGLRADSDPVRLLETVRAANVSLATVPVVNLFSQAADPVRITHRQAELPVVVDGRRAHAHEVHAIQKVYRVRKTARGEVVDEVRPLFSLTHDDMMGAAALPPDGLADAAPRPHAGEDASSQGGVCLAYWQMHRDEALAQRSPGHEVSLSLVDAHMDLHTPAVETLSLEVLATNRDWPRHLAAGLPGGDLFMEGGGPARSIALVRKPTRSHRRARDRGLVWRLISQLSINHLSLSGGGLEALKELLRLHELPSHASNRRQIDALHAVAFEADTAWLPGQPHACFVRGTHVRLTLDEACFAGTGLSLFVAVMDQFFGLYVQANSFSRLTVLSSRTQEELIACPPRHGARPLL